MSETVANVTNNFDYFSVLNFDKLEAEEASEPTEFTVQVSISDPTISKAVAKYLITKILEDQTLEYKIFIRVLGVERA